MLRNLLNLVQPSADSKENTKATTIDSELDNLATECVISGEFFKNPVSTPCGHTFEAKDMKEWISKGPAKNDKGETVNDCPQCHTKLCESDLRPNFLLSALLIFVKKQKDALKNLSEKEQAIQKHFQKVTESEKLVTDLEMKLATAQKEKTTIIESYEQKLKEIQTNNAVLQEMVNGIAQIIQSKPLEKKAEKQNTPVSYVSHLNLFPQGNKPDSTPEPQVAQKNQKVVSMIESLRQTEKLVAAIKSRNVQAATQALQDGANPNFVDETGAPLLTELARGNNLSLLKILIQFGADVNIRNKSGDTALHWAAYNANKDMVYYLLEINADPRVKNNEYRTPCQEMLNGNKGDHMMKIALETREKELDMAKTPLLRRV